MNHVFLGAPFNGNHFSELEITPSLSEREEPTGVSHGSNTSQIPKGSGEYSI